MTLAWKDHLVINSSICHGKVCIKGTRVMVSVVLDCLAEGMTEAEIIAEYPSLKRGDIHAAIAYAASLSRSEIIPLDIEC